MEECIQYGGTAFDQNAGQSVIRIERREQFVQAFTDVPRAMHTANALAWVCTYMNDIVTVLHGRQRLGDQPRWVEQDDRWRCGVNKADCKFRFVNQRGLRSNGDACFECAPVVR